MACPIIQGNEILCRDSVGGVREIILTEYTNVPQGNITSSSGVITAATCSSGKRFFTVQLEKENAQFDEKDVVSVENGTVYNEQTLTFTVKKMSAAQRNWVRTLIANRCYVVVKDNNGVNSWMGRVNGADVTTRDGTTGKALGDMNGMTITLTAKEPNPPETLSDSIYSSLQVGS